MPPQSHAHKQRPTRWTQLGALGLLCSAAAARAAAVVVPASSFSDNAYHRQQQQQQQHAFQVPPEPSLPDYSQESTSLPPDNYNSASRALHLYPAPGLHAGHAALDAQQRGIAQPLTLFADAGVYDVARVSARVSHVRDRRWKEVMMGGCSYYRKGKGEGEEEIDLKGGIEACELQDLAEAQQGTEDSTQVDYDQLLASLGIEHASASSTSTSSSNSSRGVDPSRCVPHAVTLDGRALFGASLAPKSHEHRDGETPVAGPPREQLATPACRLIEEMLGRRRRGAPQRAQVDEEAEAEEEAAGAGSPRLFSFVLTITAPLKRTSPTHPAGPARTHSFWLGHYALPARSRARGLWPLAGNAHDATSGEVRWTGRQINRIAGMMYDPYIPYAEQKRGGFPRPPRWPPGAAEAESEGAGEGEREGEAAEEEERADAHALLREPGEAHAVRYDDEGEALGAAANLGGVGVALSRYNLGLSIRAPFNTRASDPPLEPVHAPVGGQVVWRGAFTRVAPPHPHPPSKGDSSSAPRGEADEGHAISIRDEWGFVWHLTGVEADSIAPQLGDEVAVGDVVAQVKRQGKTTTTTGGSSAAAAAAELHRHAPANNQGTHAPLPLDTAHTDAAMDATTTAAARNDPYRFKSLRILVTRPPAHWTAWPEPFAPGWTYYDPLHFLLNEYDVDDEAEQKRAAPTAVAAAAQPRVQQWRSTIPPDATPAKIFFAPAVVHPLNMSLQVEASSADLRTPVLSGRVQILAAFDAFVQTPGDGDDAMDGTGLYSLQWGVIRGFQDEEKDWDPARCEFVGNELDGSEWRVAFEHDKVSRCGVILYLAAFLTQRLTTTISTRHRSTLSRCRAAQTRRRSSRRSARPLSKGASSRTTGTRPSTRRSATSSMSPRASSRAAPTCTAPGTRGARPTATALTPSSSAPSTSGATSAASRARSSSRTSASATATLPSSNVPIAFCCFCV